MTHTEVSFYMNDLLKLAMQNLFRDGYAFPIITAITKGEDKKPHIVHELIAQQSRNVLYKGEAVQEEHLIINNEELVYAYLYLLGLSKLSDEDHFEFITKTIARTGDPDAIGLFSCVVYNEYIDISIINREDVLKDSEAVRAIHGIYYIREDPIRRECYIPYINRGEKTNPLPFTDEKKSYDILPAYSGWYLPKPREPKKLKNPYDYK